MTKNEFFGGTSQKKYVTQLKDKIQEIYLIVFSSFLSGTQKEDSLFLKKGTFGAQ